MRARQLVRALGGDWYGRYGLAPGPGHSRHDRSLKVWDGPDGIRVHSFAGEDWRRIKDNLRAQGLLPGRDELQAQRAPPGIHAWSKDDDVVRKQALARRIWERAEPAAGTPAEAYLRGRGIELSMPDTLRFAPALKHAPTNQLLPAIVGAVVDMAGRLNAVHRTFLCTDGRGKASVTPSRMMLGRCAGGAVRLAPCSARLAIAEGLETALSVLQATGIPTWAALSTPGLRALNLPRVVREVVILADGDAAGELAALGAARRFLKEGRRVRIAHPPRGLDFADMLVGRVPDCVEVTAA